MLEPILELGLGLGLVLQALTLMGTQPLATALVLKSMLQMLNVPKSEISKKLPIFSCFFVVSWD